jgi:hypothetical protein
MWFYLNGRFVEDAEATVPVTDHSFLYGDGCFEGIGVCNGRVLHLDEHVERMFKSARMLRIAMPVSPAELHDLILETASRNGMAESKMGYLRPLVSRGSGPLGLKYSNKLGKATLVIIPQLGDRRIAYTEIESFTAVSRATSVHLQPDARITRNNHLTYIPPIPEAQDRGADIATCSDPEGGVVEGRAPTSPPCMNAWSCAEEARSRSASHGRTPSPPRDTGTKCESNPDATYPLWTSVRHLSSRRSTEDQSMRRVRSDPDQSRKIRDAYVKFAELIPGLVPLRSSRRSARMSGSASIPRHVHG